MKHIRQTIFDGMRTTNILIHSRPNIRNNRHIKFFKEKRQEE